MKQRPWSRLRWQLMLGFLPLILIPVLVTGIVSQGVTEQGLKLLVTQRAQHRAQEVAQQAALYYRQYGSFSGISDLLIIPPWLPVIAPLYLPTGDHDGAQVFLRSINSEQTLIADVDGNVIASDGSVAVGQPISAAVLERGAPILVDGRWIGTLVIGEALGILNDEQRQILDTVNAALLASGAVSAALAAALGLWLSWQITRPAEQLRIGVQRLSVGKWQEPLKVTTKNEFGDLTRAFNAMAIQITHEQQLRRQMVADVAHDLRTPLMAMMLEVEAVEAGLQQPEEAAASLREEITWLQRLVDDLRTLSLMDADQIRLNLEAVPLQPFLNAVGDFWQTLAEEQKRTLAIETAPDLPVVRMDAGRMRQVLGNLIDNGLRHTRAGGRIAISAHREGHAALISVTDNGEGIAPDDLPYIFDRFYRADRARQHDEGHGSGLGLSIAQKLTELHGGTIVAQSALGQGTTITIRLPV